jgi:AcrR family transcriptional regulator
VSTHFLRINLILKRVNNMDSQSYKNKEFLKELFLEEHSSEKEFTKRQWQILNAAIKVFSKKGFGNSRISEIAKEANVAEGTIFRYYKTKNDLLIGLIVPLITKFFKPLVLESVEAIMRNDKGKPIDEIMTDLYIDRLDLIEKNFSLIKTIFIESTYNADLFEIVQKKINSNLIPLINNFVEENVKNKNFREIEPILITKTIMSFIIGHILLTKIMPEFFNGKDDNKENIKNMVDILLHGIGNYKYEINKKGSENIEEKEN